MERIGDCPIHGKGIKCGFYRMGGWRCNQCVAEGKSGVTVEG